MQRFPGVFDANRPEVVLLMEGVNGLPRVGPDISAGVMRIMVQTREERRRARVRRLDDSAGRRDGRARRRR